MALSLGVIAPASAEPNHWATSHEVFGPDISEDFCGVAGLTVKETGVADIRRRTVTHGADGLQYRYESTNETDTFTNVATGEVMTTVSSGRGGEKRITDNGDGTLTILNQYTRNVLFISAGQVVARDTGVFRFEQRWDHGGTPTDRTDDVLLGFQIVKDTGQKGARCSVVPQAIG
jgi:hypothetical protein